MKPAACVIVMLLSVLHAVPARCGQASASAPEVDFQRTIARAAATLDALSKLISASQDGRQQRADASRKKPGMFSDVPRTDAAYAQVTALARHGALRGYPSGYFSGRRIVTRYEFAVAIHRTLQSDVAMMPVHAEDVVGIEPDLRGPSSRLLPREDILHLRALIDEFDPELRALGMNVPDVRKRLDAVLTGPAGV